VTYELGFFENEGPLEHILHDAQPLDDVGQRLFVERNRQQIVRVAPGDSRPAQVIRDPAGFRPLREIGQLSQIVEIERIGTADRQRDSVHHDGITLGYLLQDVSRPPLRIEKVFGDDFEPIDRRPLRQNVPEVSAPQSDAQAEVRIAEAGSEHGAQRAQKIKQPGEDRALEFLLRW